MKNNIEQNRTLNVIPKGFIRFDAAVACPAISDQHTCIHLRLSNDAVITNTSAIGGSRVEAFASARFCMKN